jgi:hypothetical protein
MSPRSRWTRRGAAAAAALVFVAVAIVTAARAVALNRRAPPLDAVGERRFHRWADRDPRLLPWLAEAAARSRPGEAVIATCSPECETHWLWVMAAYGLPRQQVVAAKTEGDSRGLRPTKVEWSRSGLRLIGRRNADGPR